MNVYKNARLTPRGREILISRHGRQRQHRLSRRSGCRISRTSKVLNGNGHGCIFLRSQQSLATRNKREYERIAAAIFSQGKLLVRIFAERPQ